METIPTAKEFIKPALDGLGRINKEHAEFLLIEFAKLHVIAELKKHIEHPTKPGYKRHDILQRIKELEKT